jgi:hypothetical protein
MWFIKKPTGCRGAVIHRHTNEGPNVNSNDVEVEKFEFVLETPNFLADFLHIAVTPFRFTCHDEVLIEVGG